MSGVRVSEVNLLKRMIADGLVDKARAQDLLVDVAYRRKKGEVASLTDTLLEANVVTLEQLIEYAAAGVPSATTKPDSVSVREGAHASDPGDAAADAAVNTAAAAAAPSESQGEDSSPGENAVMDTAAQEAAYASSTEAATDLPAPSEAPAAAQATEEVPSERWNEPPRYSDFPGSVSVDAAMRGDDDPASRRGETQRDHDPNAAPDRDLGAAGYDEGPGDYQQADGYPRDRRPAASEADNYDANGDRDFAGSDSVGRTRARGSNEQRLPAVPPPDDGFPSREFVSDRQVPRNARFTTGRRIPIALIVVLLFVGGAAGGVIWWVQRPRPLYTEGPVRECFGEYRDALTNKNGQAAARLIDRSTAEHYQDMRFQALMATRAELQEMSELDRFHILAIRHSFPGAEEVTKLTGYQVFAHFVDHGWIRAEHVASLELGDVQISGSEAIGGVVSGAQELSIQWRFNREGEAWKIAVVPLENIVRDDDATDEELLLRLQTVSGTEVSTKIWNPLLK